MIHHPLRGGPSGALLLAGLVLFCHRTVAASLPPEQLLPRDTVLMVTAPDFPKARAFVSNSSYGRLWQDPAMKPFREKFMSGFHDDVLKPLEQTFGFDTADFQKIARGQVTFALVSTDHGIQPLLLIDAKDHADDLRTNLAGIVRKWSDAGKSVKTRQIREITFTTLIVSPSDFSWDKIIPGFKASDSGAKPTNSEVTFGQSGSLLIVGNSADAIEKVLVRQSGGLIPALNDLASFQSDYLANFHDAPIYAWANAEGLIASISKAASDSADDSGSGRWSAILDLTGLSAISSASLSYENLPDGMEMQLFVRAPEEKRQGLLRMLAAGRKDSGPPAFVAANCAKFWRWRIDIPKGWHEFEAMLNGVNPQLMGLLNVVLQNAGKDKDEHYDLKAELLNNLGDDVICCQKAPPEATVSSIKSPPSLYLIGSPSPERLASALKVGLGFLAQAAGGIQDREFLGHKVYSAPLSSGAQGGPAATLNFAASGSYVAISSDPSYLEQYLRSAENPPAPLSEIAGFRDATQKIGGVNGGWFGYENQSDAMRQLYKLLRSQPQAFADLYSPPTSGNPNTSADQVVSKIRDWADFTLLPAYDDVAKYYYWSIYSGTFSPEGFTLKLFAPTPPGLR